MAGEETYGKARKSFRSLRDCFEYVKEEFPETRVLRNTWQKVDGSRLLTRVPKYLYRGEERRYPTTTSRLARLQADPCVSQEVKETIQRVKEQCDRYIQKFLQDFNKLTKMKYLRTDLNSLGYLQHYGMPTELIDFTSSLEVDAYFASVGTIGEKGLMCILPTDVFSHYDTQSPEGQIIDLTDNPTARRARTQKSYVVRLLKLTDLKDDRFVEDGVRWFEFTLTQTDKKDFHSNHALIDLEGDQVAIFVSQAVHAYVNELGKINDEAARWLADHIEAVPSIWKPQDVSGHNQEVWVPVSLKELVQAGKYSSERDLRDEYYRKWSLSYPNDRPVNELPNSREQYKIGLLTSRGPE